MRPRTVWLIVIIASAAAIYCWWCQWWRSHDGDDGDDGDGDLCDVSAYICKYIQLNRHKNYHSLSLSISFSIAIDSSTLHTFQLFASSAYFMCVFTFFSALDVYFTLDLDVIHSSCIFVFTLQPPRWPTNECEVLFWWYVSFISWGLIMVISFTDRVMP